MQFTIITPSYNQVDHLRRCVASVRDQVGSQSEQKSEVGSQRSEVRELISVHHHVQDGVSTDGTRGFLLDVDCLKLDGRDKNYSFSFTSEADGGMYDAINKGVAFSLKKQVVESVLLDDRKKETLGIEQLTDLGKHQLPTSNFRDDSVVAWLNCDEQYLPYTLEKVAAFFASNPKVDLLFGGMLVVDEAGELLACRKAMPMRKRFLEASYLYNYSCAMFFRESLWRKLGGFDTSFKNTGDEELIRRAVKLGARSAVLGEYLATFTYSDANLSSDPAAVEEHERLKSRMGKLLRFAINLMRLGEKFIRGGHVERGSIDYKIYADSLEHRTRFLAENPLCAWPGEVKPYLTKHRLERGV